MCPFIYEFNLSIISEFGNLGSTVLNLTGRRAVKSNQPYWAPSLSLRYTQMVVAKENLRISGGFLGALSFLATNGSVYRWNVGGDSSTVLGPHFAKMSHYMTRRQENKDY